MPEVLDDHYAESLVTEIEDERSKIKA